MIQCMLGRCSQITSTPMCTIYAHFPVATNIRIILSQLEHSVRHGRSSQGDECEPGKHLAQRESAVESIGKLGEVARQVLGADVVVAAMQRALDVAQDRIDP